MKKLIFVMVVMTVLVGFSLAFATSPYRNIVPSPMTSSAASKVERGYTVLSSILPGQTKNIDIVFSVPFIDGLNYAVVVTPELFGNMNPNDVSVGVGNRYPDHVFIYIKNNSIYPRDVYFSWIAVGD